MWFIITTSLKYKTFNWGKKKSKARELEIKNRKTSIRQSMLITKEGSARGENEIPTTWLFFFPSYFPEKGKKNIRRIFIDHSPFSSYLICIGPKGPCARRMKYITFLYKNIYPRPSQPPTASTSTQQHTHALPSPVLRLGLTLGRSCGCENWTKVIHVLII